MKGIIKINTPFSRTGRYLFYRNSNSKRSREAKIQDKNLQEMHSILYCIFTSVCEVAYESWLEGNLK